MVVVAVFDLSVHLLYLYLVNLFEAEKAKLKISFESTLQKFLKVTKIIKFKSETQNDSLLATKHTICVTSTLKFSKTSN